MTRSCIALTLFTLFACACGRTDARSAPESSPARLTVLAGPEQLRQEFSRRAGHPRLVLFLSPT